MLGRGCVTCSPRQDAKCADGTFLVGILHPNTAICDAQYLSQAISPTALLMRYGGEVAYSQTTLAVRCRHVLEWSTSLQQWDNDMLFARRKRGRSSMIS